MFFDPYIYPKYIKKVDDARGYYYEVLFSFCLVLIGDSDRDEGVKVGEME